MSRTNSFMVKDGLDSLIDELACPNKSNVKGVVSRKDGGPRKSFS